MEERTPKRRGMLIPPARRGCRPMLRRADAGVAWPGRVVAHVVLGGRHSRQGLGLVLIEPWPSRVRGRTAAMGSADPVTVH